MLGSVWGIFKLVMSCDEKEREVGFIGSILSLGIVVTVYGKVERFILHEDKLFLKG